MLFHVFAEYVETQPLGLMMQGSYFTTMLFLDARVSTGYRKTRRRGTVAIFFVIVQAPPSSRLRVLLVRTDGERKRSSGRDSVKTQKTTEAGGGGRGDSIHRG